MASRIYLESIGYLDCAETIPIPLNFSLAQVQDVSARNSAFSKTIVLPNTKNNQELLGQIFEINMNINDCDYNVNRKVKCTIYQDDTPVLENGYLQLKNIKKISKSDISQDEQITYEVVVFQNQTDLFTTLGNAYITDISFSGMNHILNFSGVTSTSGNTYIDGYKYLWHYCFDDIYYIKNFRPAIYAKEIVDRIFYENNFSYTNDSFFNTDVFKHLVHPSNTYSLEISDSEKESREFRVSVDSGNTIYYSGLTVAHAAPNTSYSDNLFITPVTFTMPQVGNAPVMPYSDETTGINYDGTRNSFDTTTYTWNVKATGSFNVSFKYSGEITFSTPSNVLWITGATIYDVPTILVTTTILNATTYENLGSNITEVQIPLNYYNSTVFSPSLFFSGLTTGTYTVPFEVNVQDYLIDANAGEDIVILYSAYYPVSFFPDVNENFVPFTIGFSVDTSYSDIDNYLSVTAIKNEIQDGDTIDFQQIVPQNTKQKDYLKSIFDAFNLYIEQDSDNENLFKIKPRDEYFSDYAGQYLDWTDKMDYSQEYSTQLLSQLQDKRINFKYKKGEDLLNKRYFNTTKYEYGQYILNFDNDFLTSEKKIELMFEPTPLVRNNVHYSAGSINTSFIVPYIVPNTEGNLKLLYDGGNLTTDEEYPVQWIDNSGNTQVTNLSWYNYMGHFDNPIDATFDLNFTTNQYYFYNDEDANITDGNLFNLYWYNYIQLISESKMLTAYFNLNEYDILNLNFAKKIWIRDSYWILNKVIDYDASSIRLTKCELIKDIASPVFNKRRTIAKPLLTAIQASKPFMQVGIGLAGDNISVGDLNNNNYGSGTFINGSGINIQRNSNTGIVNGSGVTVGQNNSRFVSTGNNVKIGSANIGVSVFGDSNRIGSLNENLFLQGTGNNISGITRNVSLLNSRNVTITGNVQNVSATNVDGVTIDESNVIWLGNNFTVRDTGITVNSITINGTGTSVFNSLSATTLSGGTYYSGSTPLETIISNIASAYSGGTGTPTYLQNGTNTYTGGTAALPTVNISGLSINNLTATGSTQLGNTFVNGKLTGSTFYSGGTLLETNIQRIAAQYSATTYVQPGTNTYTGGTAALPTINVSGLTVHNLKATGSTQSISASTTVGINNSTFLCNFSSTNAVFSNWTGLAGISVNSPSSLRLTGNTITFHSSGSTFLGVVNAVEISATTLSATTYYSGSTPLETIIASLASGTGSTPTYVGNGLNTYTGGTNSNPTVNISAATLNTLTTSGYSYMQALNTGKITGATYYSGATLLSTIIDNIAAQYSGTTTLFDGLNTYIRGSATAPTVNISSATLSNLSVSGSANFISLSATSLSAGTYFSGSTPLETIIVSLAGGTPAGNYLTASTISGLTKITVAITQPTTPSTGDLWINSN